MTAAGGGDAPRRVLVAGATGYIGRHVVRELVQRGYEVVAPVRARSGIGGRLTPERAAAAFPGADVRVASASDPASLVVDGLRGERVDAVISCIATRTGGARDAWSVDYAANCNLLAAARAAGAEPFVLLSAICVQKPRLAFQHAKLAFERELRGAGLNWSIVRPTAFFKSIAGQVPRVQAGKPFLLFGRGDGPLCKPISEADTARCLADCLERPALTNRVLPVGGPGPAVSAVERGRMLFELCGRSPRFRRIPLRLFDIVESPLALAGRHSPKMADRAEFARIGRYYATESMLWLDPATGRYDADATPAYGSDTLHAFYARVVAEGMAGQELGDQALF